MNENVDNVSTHMDDAGATGPSEQEMLDAVMSNPPLMAEAGDVPLPEEHDPVEDSVESDEEVEDPESDEAEIEEEVEEVDSEGEEVEGEDAGDEPATQEPEVYSLDDLEEFNVMVKIDGEETSVSINDLVKGYTTDQSLSNKGRELSEARKELEAERDEKLAQLDSMGKAAANMLGGQEQVLAKQYHEMENKIAEARNNGDTYELAQLKDQQELIQKNYWQARQNREGLIKATAEQQEKVQQEQLQSQIANFQEVIPTMIPDFSEDVAMEIRDFALKKGIAENLLDSVVDPNIVKFIDDYRRMEAGLSKGAAKRKAAPQKKTLPAKKAKTPQKKTQDAKTKRKVKAFSENSSADDQMAFLRDYASNSLNL